MSITRVFTKEWDKYEYNDINFVTKTTKFAEDRGRVHITRNVITPDFWSQNASNIVSRNHLRRHGVAKYLQRVPEDGVPEWLQRSEPVPDTDNPIGDEHDVSKMMDRLAGTWAYWGWKGGYFATEEDTRAFYDECRYILIHQMACVNSPQLFNTGIYWAYGIAGEPQGHFYVDDNRNVVPSTSAYERPQAHACYILSIEDSLGSIMDFATRESRIFKYGSGSGANFSGLRGKGEKLSSGGTSSGLMSFLNIFDVIAGSIKSGGSTRRAAKMVVLDQDHPEVLDFTNWKVREEDKVVSLIVGSKIVDDWLKKVKTACEASYLPGEDRCDFLKNLELQSVIVEGAKNHIPLGYISRVINLLQQNKKAIDWEVFNSSYDNEAYMTVAGQNSNNSISVTNDFMRKVLNNEMLDLTARVTGETLKKVSAADLFDQICAAGWKCGDPALQFNTTMNERVTCFGKVNATNPCTEFVYKDDNPCNLGSINLCSFYNGIEIDVSKYVHTCKLLTVVLEIAIYMAQYPSKIIAENAYKNRTLGLGYANLGGLLMKMGIPYDSDEGRALGGYLAALMNITGYETSSEMASFLGAFEGYAEDKEKMLKIIDNHIRAIFGEEAVGFEIQPVPLDRQYIPQAYLEVLDKIALNVREIANIYGFRNSQLTVLAPTGTIGLIMDCQTTGIEPAFALITYKKLAGGGYMKFINDAVPDGLAKLGYKEAEIDDIVRYIVGHGSMKDSLYINIQTLTSLGITREDVLRMEEQLSATTNLHSLISYHNLSPESMANLNIDSSNLPKVKLLKLLGFKSNEIEIANAYICGNQTIEGAPHVNPTHCPVFSCAVKCGINGKQFISPMAHVKMMASVQTHISGAISKTVNLPEEATIQDFKDVYITAWQMGIKAIALFRSGSKLASALETEGTRELSSIIKKNKRYSEPVSKLPRGVREVLPEMRRGYNIKGIINGKQIYWNVGFDDQGNIKEVFINGGDREGSELRSIMSCFAKALSLALQYGAPLDELIAAFKGAKFEPSGITRFTDFSGQETSLSVASPIDYIVQVLGMLGKLNSPSNIKKMDYSGPIKKMDYNVNSPLMGYTGDTCSNCDSDKMIRDGTCKKCEACGTTTGCG